MIFDKQWRINRLKVQLAGLNARLEAVRCLARTCAKNVPGVIVLDLIETPERIAELETILQHLEQGGPK